MKKIFFIIVLFSVVVLKSQSGSVKKESILHEYPNISKPIQIQLSPIGWEISDREFLLRGLISARIFLKNSFCISTSFGTVLASDNKRAYTLSPILPLERIKFLSYINLNGTWYFYNKITKKDIDICISQTFSGMNGNRPRYNCNRSHIVPSKKLKSFGLRIGITKAENPIILTAFFSQDDLFYATNKTNTNEVIQFHKTYNTSGTTFQNMVIFNFGLSFRTLINSIIWLEIQGYQNPIKAKNRRLFEYYIDILYAERIIFSNVITTFDQKEWVITPVNPKFHNYGFLVGVSFSAPHQGFTAKLEAGSRPHSPYINDGIFNLVLGYTFGFKATALTKKEN